MPKSGQGRQKRMVRKKKADIRSRQASGEQQMAAPAQMKAVAPQAAAPTAAPRASKAMATLQSINITVELRRIGILTAIIIVILVVLAQILA